MICYETSWQKGATLDDQITNPAELILQILSINCHWNFSSGSTKSRRKFIYNWL